VGGLLRYLFGPGKREEHARPRLVAAWDGAGDLTELQPAGRSGRWYDVRRLRALLEQPVRAGFQPLAKTVWHCSIRTHPTDRVLTDGQWAHIAGEVMAAVGLAPHGDGRAVRWVAVRHNDDHVHLVATLVRQDRRRVWPWQDMWKAQSACRDLEERYGLYRVTPPGQGSRRWPSPSELNKTARLATPHRRGVVPRDELRRRVRAVGAIAVDEVDFFRRLAANGVLVRLRHSARQPNEVTGYAVGLDGHTTAAGSIVWYGGGRLAADLTLPRLRSRWTGEPAPASNAARVAAEGSAVPQDLHWRASEHVRLAAAAMADAADPAYAGAISDLMASIADAWEGKSGGLLTDAADALDRAARGRDERGPGLGRGAGRLRAMGRLVALAGKLSRDQDLEAALTLTYTIAAFAESLAILREAHGRLHQAQAAQEGAAKLASGHAKMALARSR
jgi:hypothetical protein